MENTVAATPSVDVPKDAKTFGMLCHLGALAGYLIPLGNILGPFIFWQIKKNEFPFVDDQGKEAINFQITVFIAAMVCIPLIFLFGIGMLLLLAVGIADLVFLIIGALKANEGIAYRYPFALRLIK